MGKLVCEICGGSLLMNADNVAECESCGMKYAKEKIAQMVKIDGAVEITKGEAEKERILKNAQIFLELGDVSKAEKLYMHIINEYPDDYRGWFGAFRCKFEYINITVQDLIEAEFFEERIVILGYSQITGKFWDNLFNDKENFNIIERSHVEYKDKYSIIDNFSAELICYETKKLPPKLKKLQLIVGENYIKNFLNGDVLAFKTAHSKFWGEHLGFSTFGDSSKKSDVLSQLFNMGIKNAQQIEKMPKIERKEFLNSIGFYSPHEKIKVEFILGKTLLYLDFDDINSHELREVNEVVTPNSINNFINEKKRSERRSNFVCQHCGGMFKGFLNKRCSVCGKEKDY